MSAAFKFHSPGPRHCRPLPQALEDYAPPEARRPALPEPAAEPELDRLDDIALLLRRLTYEEMMELAGGLWQPMLGTMPATQEELAKLIHGWSTSR